MKNFLLKRIIADDICIYTGIYVRVLNYLFCCREIRYICILPRENQVSKCLRSNVDALREDLG